MSGRRSWRESPLARSNSRSRFHLETAPLVIASSCLPSGDSITATLAPVTMGDRIRRARIGAGYRSQASFARALGVSKGLVHQWESYGKPPGRENMLKVAQLTAVSPQYLAGKTDEMRPPSVTVDDAVLVRILLAAQRLPRDVQQNLAELLEKTVSLTAKS